MRFDKGGEIGRRDGVGERGAGDFEEEDGEGLERARVEESGGETGLGGGEEMREALEDGHLVD